MGLGSRLGKGFVEFFLKSDRFTAGAKVVTATLARMKHAMQAASRAARNVLFIGAAAAAGLVKLAIKQIDAEAKLSGVLRATGNAAGFTAKELIKQAGALQKVTTFGDDVIINAQAILATFKQIKGQEFIDATEAMLDMSAALGTDLKGSAIQLGKALNDPVKGISALSRVGVAFSEQQIKQIKQFTAANDLMGAQRVILDELKGEFGGVAREMAKTDVGQFRQALNELGDAGEQFGMAIIKQLLLLRPHLDEFTAWVKSLSRDDIAGLIEDAKTLGKTLIFVWAAPKLLAAISGFVQLVIASTAAVGALATGGLALLAGAYTLVAQQAWKAVAAGKALMALGNDEVKQINRVNELRKQLAATNDPKKQKALIEDLITARKRLIDLRKQSLSKEQENQESGNFSRSLLLGFGGKALNKDFSKDQDRINAENDLVDALSKRLSGLGAGAAGGAGGAGGRGSGAPNPLEVIARKQLEEQVKTRTAVERSGNGNIGVSP